MTSFYFTSQVEQSVLMICLFFTMTAILFCLVGSYYRTQSKRNVYFNVGLFLILLALLSILNDTFGKTESQQPYNAILSLPMWLLWCVVAVSNILIIIETVLLFQRRNKSVSRFSVKQAMDTLPTAISYFTPTGSVKLCNLQMHRLFRTLAQSDMQTFDELQNALEKCDGKSGVIRLPDIKQAYLFPSGKVWRYSQNEVTASDGVTYTEVIFSDVTELYEKNLKLKEQTKQLKKISADLKVLSDNVSTMTKEKELLSAKTKLHDRMSAGIIAMRQIILQKQKTQEAEQAVQLFSKAVSAIKNDNEYSWERGDLAEFMHDAETIGVEVELSGELPKQQEVYRLFIIAMRECLTNSVRHADATRLTVEIQNDSDAFSVRITNNGKIPEKEVAPKGGLLNLYRHLANCRGNMEIQSKPFFALTVTVPKSEEVTQ